MPAYLFPSLTYPSLLVMVTVVMIVYDHATPVHLPTSPPTYLLIEVKTIAVTVIVLVMKADV